MHRILAMCLEAGIALVILVPVFLALDKYYVHNWNRTLSYLIFAFYLAAVDAVVGLPSIHYIRFDLNINLKPFAYMFSDYKNSFLNVLLFMPLGFLLPFLCPYFKAFFRAVLFGFCASLLIELLQIFTFRATDVNDLMTNTLGAVLGWCAARLVLRLAPSASPGWKPKEVYLVCGVTFGVMIFLQPFLAELVWALF